MDVRCPWCERMVRTDKPFFGSIHFCLTPAEKQQKLIMLDALRPQSEQMARAIPTADIATPAQDSTEEHRGAGV